MWRRESKQQGLGGSTRLTGERTATKEAMTAGDGPGTPEGAPLTQIVDQGTPEGGCPYTQMVDQGPPGGGCPHTQTVGQGTPEGGVLTHRWWVRGPPRGLLTPRRWIRAPPRDSSHSDGGSGEPRGGCLHTQMVGQGTPRRCPHTQTVGQGTSKGGCPHTQMVDQGTPEGAPHTHGGSWDPPVRWP